MYSEPVRGRMLNRAVVFTALALGVGNVALAGSTVTPSDASSDVTIVQTVASEPIDSPNWFPALPEEETRLALAPSPMQSVALDPSATLALTPTGGLAGVEHTAIPLPPAAWSGLLGLGSLATYSWRKAITKFFT